MYLQNYRIDTSLADNIIFLSEKDQHEMAKELNFVSKMPWNSFAGEIITPRNIIGVCFLNNTLNTKEVASYDKVYHPLKEEKTLDIFTQLRMVQKRYLISMTTT